MDWRLSDIFRRSKFSAKAVGTQETYAPDYRLFFTFLWQRGKNWDEATADDLADWEDWRLRGVGNPQCIGGVKWDRELAALRLLYDVAVSRQYVPASPVLTYTVMTKDGAVVESAELAARDVRSSDVKWLTPRAFRLWRDVGLGGLDPDGLEDDGWRGRNDGRDVAFADFVYSCGLRRREAGTLLTAELPVADQRRYSSGNVAQAIAKRSGRYFYVSHAALRSVEAYRISSRAHAVRKAQRRGAYERVPGRRVIESISRQGRVRWRETDGRRGEAALDKLDDRQRLLLFGQGDDGLEPAMLWLTESGMPFRYRSWSKVFERASDRCESRGLTVYATPKMLRHSMALRMLLALNHALDRRFGFSSDERRRYQEIYGEVWQMVKDLLGHASEETTREIYLEPVRGLQLESLLNDDNPHSDLLMADLARRTGLILDVA
ncbi:integrase [Streptomyces sp. NPDC048680]|uniref:integrase n=1 Tax=Streptomyces sp. NPDC048680 TaxID=3155492 RepID=UPI00343E963C